jgi:large subunit ribosomal protein L13
MDMGGYVVVVNAEKVVVTGDKANQKMYYRHTGRPGSLKTESFKHLQAVSDLDRGRSGARPNNCLGWPGHSLAS